jgi:glutathione peroxidase
MNKSFGIIIKILISFLLFSCSGGKENLNPEEKEKTNIYNYSVTDIDGAQVNLSDYKGKVLLIVNVASECGFTTQYEGLQKIYEEYKSKGFEILAFPCNDFMGQEPGTNEDIKNFCSMNFNVTFKLFDKITLDGENQSKLFEMLTNNPRTGDSSIYWNFEKFIIDKNGYVVDRFRSTTEPEDEDITQLIDKLLLLN